MKEELLYCANLSRIAYKRRERIIEEITHLSKEISEIDIYEKNEFKVITFKKDCRLYIVFRGSKGVRNWINNFRINKTDGIHSGFYEGMGDLFPFIFSKVENNTPIVITGHSLGGALAILTADKLFNMRYKVESCITFGQPRVFNRKYKKQNVNNKFNYIRVVNNNDAVVNLPPAWAGYIHRETKLIYFNSNNEYVKDKYTFKQMLKDRFNGFRKGLRNKKIDNVEDHYADGYIKDIERM